MAGIRHNIIFSVMAHSILLAAALLAGGSSEIRKAPLVTVSFLDEKESSSPGKQAADTGKKQNVPAVAMTPKADSEKVTESAAPQVAIPKQNPAPLVLLKPQTDISSDSASGVAGAAELYNPSPVGGRSTASFGNQTSLRPSGESGAVSAPDGRTGKASEGSTESSLRRRIRDALQANLIYPYIARQRRIEGTVLMEFSINGRGMPEGVRIIKGSSYSILDEAARETVLKTSPFPATSTMIEVPIRFSLRGN